MIVHVLLLSDNFYTIMLQLQSIITFKSTLATTWLFLLLTLSVMDVDHPWREKFGSAILAKIYHLTIWYA